MRLVGAAVPRPDQVARAREHLGRWTTAVRGPEAAAEATATALGVEPSIDEALAAPSYGEWSGRPLEEVLADDPEAAVSWRTDPTWAPPGGESLADLCDRVGTWLGTRAGEDARTLVVADAAVVRAAAVVALGAGPASCWHLDVGPLTVVRLQHHAGTWRLRALHPG